MTDQIVSTLQQNLRGRLIGPSDADYDAARALYNGMIDKRPRLIARCVDVADVIAAVNFGRDQGLLVAIRGGGHNGPGFGSCNDRVRRTAAGMPAKSSATSATPMRASIWRISSSVCGM